MVDCVVFDKTGTLTEDFLEVERVQLSKNASFTVLNNDHINKEEIICRAMASCQSLVKLNGEALGDPLEVELLK